MYLNLRRPRGLRGAGPRLLVAICGLVGSLMASGTAAALPTFPGHNGAIVFDRAVDGEAPTVWRTDRYGSDAVHLIGSAAVSFTVTQVSPNGKKMLLSGGAHGSHIWTAEVGGGGKTKLTHGAGEQGYPQWSPNGRWIAYERFPGKTSGLAILMVMRGDGTHRHEITRARQGLSIGSWSPDGKRIVYSSSKPGAPGEATVIKTVATGGGRQRTIVGPTRYSDVGEPEWSPRGGRITFTRWFSGPSGSTFKLAVVRPDGSDRHALAAGEAVKTQPAWSPDGSHIAFLRCPTGPGTLVCGLEVARRDGSGKRRLRRADVEDLAWAPNGRRLVYSWTPKEDSTALTQKPRLYVEKLDGSHMRRITRSAGGGQQLDYAPAWQPVAKSAVSSRTEPLSAAAHP